MGRRGAAALAILASVAGMGVPAAEAAPGDLVADIEAFGATIGVSVAFDGQFLWFTNLDEPILQRVTTTGEPAGVVITNAPGINAFAYDATRDMFWAADATGEFIWLVDQAGTAVPQFSVAAALEGLCDNGELKPTGGGPGFCSFLVDGIAYDATDDSVWFSPDASERVYHFGTDGTFLGFFDVNDPPEDMLPQCPPGPTRPHGNFNSGIGVGRNVAYLTAADCGFFFSYTKNPTYEEPTDCPDAADPTYCPGTKLNFFSYNGERAEDIECDNITFQPDVMWVRDEFDGHLRAYQLPTGTCLFGGGINIQDPRMTGGGGLPALLPATMSPTTDQVTHAMLIHCNEAVDPNRLQANWQGNKFHLTSLQDANCLDDPVLPTPTDQKFNTLEGQGFGRYNGMPGATVKFKFKDAGEPGTLDHGHIEVWFGGIPVIVADGFLLTGPLRGQGNYQSHPV